MYANGKIKFYTILIVGVARLLKLNQITTAWGSFSWSRGFKITLWLWNNFYECTREQCKMCQGSSERRLLLTRERQSTSHHFWHPKNVSTIKFEFIALFIKKTIVKDFFSLALHSIKVSSSSHICQARESVAKLFLRSFNYLPTKMPFSIFLNKFYSNVKSQSITSKRRTTHASRLVHINFYLFSHLAEYRFEYAKPTVHGRQSQVFDSLTRFCLVFRIFFLWCQLCKQDKFTLHSNLQHKRNSIAWRQVRKINDNVEMYVGFAIDN